VALLFVYPGDTQVCKPAGLQLPYVNYVYGHADRVFPRVCGVSIVPIGD